jgi:hypothetical protein
VKVDVCEAARAESVELLASEEFAVEVELAEPEEG